MNQFENAKVGDKVLVSLGGWGRTLEISTIEKVGKIHLTVKHHGKFRRSSGYEVGCGYSRALVMPFDQKKWDDFKIEQQEKKMRSFVQNFNWRDCNKELIATVYALLPKPEAK